MADRPKTVSFKPVGEKKKEKKKGNLQAHSVFMRWKTGGGSGNGCFLSHFGCVLVVWTSPS